MLVRLAIALLLLATTALAQRAALTGSVPIARVAASPIAMEKYAGSISGRVNPAPSRIAGVWLAGPTVRPGAPGTAQLEQEGYQFRTGLLIVQTGTRVDFPNRDDDYHNVFSLSKTKRFDLGRYRKDEAPPSVTFDKAGVVRLFCEIHQHMRGVVLVVDSPYFTTTDESGRFELRGVPPGKYTLHAWLDEKRTWEQPVTVESGRGVAVALQEK
jgi:plastocyanin